MNKKTIRDVDVKGKRCLVRCDFNVPMKDGVITDENRINGALPTIKYLMDHGAKVILCSHMGKPHNIFTEGFGLNKKEKKAIKIRKTHKKKRKIIQINEQTPSILLCKETAWQDTLFRLAVASAAERI